MASSLLLATGFILYKTGDLGKVLSPNSARASSLPLDANDGDTISAPNKLHPLLDSTQQAWLDSLELVNPLEDSLEYNRQERLDLLEQVISRRLFLMRSSKVMVVADNPHNEYDWAVKIRDILLADSPQKKERVDSGADDHRIIYPDDPDFFLHSSKSISPLFLLELADSADDADSMDLDSAKVGAEEEGNIEVIKADSNKGKKTQKKRPAGNN